MPENRESLTMTPQSIPSNDSSSNDFLSQAAIHLPREQLKQLSRIDGVKAMVAIASEWLAIVLAIGLCHHFWHPALYLLAIPFIGARQHALAVLQHDAAHNRLLPQKTWNNVVAELLLAWPILLSNQWFQQYHFRHHQHLGTDKDGNRTQYQTHTITGELKPAWTFPKTKIRLAGWLFLRLCGLAGLLFLCRGFHRILTKGTLRYRLLSLTYYATILGVIFGFQAERFLLLYWLIPLCTWFIFTNLLRLAGEHSAVNNDHPVYGLTRTTLPSGFDQIFLVPRNISYHQEHHLFPHVPFYRLPALHAALMENPDFHQQSHRSHGYWQTLQELGHQP